MGRRAKKNVREFISTSFFPPPTKGTLGDPMIYDDQQRQRRTQQLLIYYMNGNMKLHSRDSV